MKIDLSNPKHRLVFIIIALILSAIIFTTIGYFGAKNILEEQKELTASPTTSPIISPSPTTTPTTSAISKTSTEIEELRQEKADLQKQLDETRSELDSKNAASSTIRAYNDFLEYMTQVVDAHDGFVGWTDAEYQIGREKAEATGNDTFVSTVDTAWNNTSVDVTTRILNVYRGIISGIKSGLE
jgi:hypothetical protein